jgi:hypothetical protein
MVVLYFDMDINLVKHSAYKRSYKYIKNNHIKMLHITVVQFTAIHQSIIIRYVPCEVIYSNISLILIILSTELYKFMNTTL